MTYELEKKFQEVAELIYGDDKIAIECAMEDALAKGDLCITFDDFSEFEKRYSDIEIACWTRGLAIAQEGNCYIVKEDTEG